MNSKSYETIRVQEFRAGHVVTLNRPSVKNALNLVMIEELIHCFSCLSEKEGRFVVLKGEGTFFCAGADLHWMKESKKFTFEENRKDALRLVTLFQTLLNCPLPVLTLVQGGAYGGALGLIGVSDIVIAEKGAKFCFSEVKLGLVPAVVSAFTLPKIGISAARELFLTASLFGAERAKEIGLVHEIVDRSVQLDAALEKKLESILLGGPQAIQQTKRLLLEHFGKTDQKTLSQMVEVIATVRVTDEAQEGLGAFLEGKKPKWVG